MPKKADNEPATEMIGNHRDFAVDITFKDADGEDLTLTLDPMDEVDVPADEFDRVKAQIDDAKEPALPSKETKAEAAAREAKEAKAERLAEQAPEFDSDFKFYRSPIAGLAIPLGEPEPHEMQDEVRFTPHVVFDEVKGDHYKVGYLATDEQDVQEVLADDPNVEEITEDQYKEATSLSRKAA